MWLGDQCSTGVRQGSAEIVVQHLLLCSRLAAKPRPARRPGRACCFSLPVTRLGCVYLCGNSEADPTETSVIGGSDTRVAKEQQQQLGHRWATSAGAAAILSGPPDPVT